jgi:hypothetical protein
LDGKTGFLVSKISAYATYLKYKKLRMLYKWAKAPLEQQEIFLFLISFL